MTAKVTADYRGDYAVLSDIMVPDEDVPEKYYVPEEQLEKWEYLKGAKKEQRINKRTGFEYVYSEGALPFPDAVDAPARTIITGEGGGWRFSDKTCCAQRKWTPSPSRPRRARSVARFSARLDEHGNVG